MPWWPKFRIGSLAWRRKLREQAAIACCLGSGTQYVMGVAGAADSVPSQLVELGKEEQVQEESRIRRPRVRREINRYLALNSPPC